MFRQKLSFSIFANIKVDDLKRFNRLKKSFYSIKKSNPDKWIINIRGSYKRKVFLFLNKNLIKKNLIFTEYNSPLGWFYDTKKMLKFFDTKLVFIWNEDYILNDNIKNFHNILKDLHYYKIDQFVYGSLNHDNYKIFKILNANFTKNIFFKKFNKNLRVKFNKIIKEKKLIPNTYIVSLPQIMNFKTFKKVINIDDPPIKRWSKFTPFDFEKGPYDYHFLPSTIAFPTNKKLFKDIDYKREGSSVFLKNGKYFLKKKYYFFSFIKFPIKLVAINFRETINYFLSNIIKTKK
jgi:hypothetical protein